ncbi:DEAD/DEAH box helicase [Bacillus sp. 1NLA3E]|uniref:DEAD/DEAH box helicase n=1 Tax=Bacillus sp. 1NLA3E TaxID=666686 RepID=UPI000328010C|nr:superfamily II DNA/RNA helicase [Bacillus sp. 1NLA3E]
MIKLFCGQKAYEEGEVYYRNGKVTFFNYDQKNNFYEAVVEGNLDFQVTFEVDRNEKVHAECTCPPFTLNHRFCNHIAAVMWKIHYLPVEHPKPRDQKPALSSTSINEGFLEENRLTKGVLDLFTSNSFHKIGVQTYFENKEIINMSLICRPIPSENRKYIFGLELQVGLKRMYLVKNIREFLEHVDRGEPYPFSKHFTYTPELHRFQHENEAILQQLIQIYRQETIYLGADNVFNEKVERSLDKRILIIPPFLWETLLPLLVQAPLVKIEQERTVYLGIQISEEALPLKFEFDQAQSEGYQLKIQGLDWITVFESYSCVLFDGKIIKLSGDQCKLLSELMQILETYRKDVVTIPAQQMEAYMEKVIPGLMKLGVIVISKAVSDRIVKKTLKAKLYLDRLNGRLLAGLEFQYDDIIINPLERARQNRSSDFLLLREGDKEQQILEWMDQSSFTKTDGGYFMQNEEEEYQFLYHGVPQLKKLVEVYATTAVKARLYTGNTPIKIKVDLEERTDWLVFKFELDGIPESELRQLIKSVEEKRKYYRLPNGSLLSLESKEFKKTNRLLNELINQKEDLIDNELRLPVMSGLNLMDSYEKVNGISLGKSFRRLLENLRNPDIREFPVPDSLVHTLRDYQEYGFQWLKTLAHYRFGGILADEMGLGKTIQSIAFIVSVLPEIRTRELPAIIVAPASLVYNWFNELKKFAPEVRVAMAEGSKTERSRIVKDLSAIDVLITSYPLLRQDIKIFQELSFHTLILDEAQAFKNYTTQTARAVKKIQAKHRFALTGTPIENSLEELWSIFDVVFPELFQNRAKFHDLSRETVANRVRPFILRRVKSDVLKELPEKIESQQASELLPEQKKLYAAYLAKLRQETLKHLNEGGLKKNRIKILAGLTRLRQLCLHPALFIEGYAGSSAKFEQLLEIIEECRNEGKRLLIFSQFTQMLKIIGKELAYQGIPYFYLDGNTPGSERVELCNRFNDGEKEMFLISLKAGGTGLNLTGADTVVLYDLWWNPAVEQQAADRAHRIGQKKIVQVIRLVSQGTIEDKMYELQQRKKNLIDEVVQPGQETLSTLTEQEIKDILSI